MVLINRLQMKSKVYKMMYNYANAVKNSKEAIIVRPKEKQESSTTRNDLKEKLSQKIWLFLTLKLEEKIFY